MDWVGARDKGGGDSEEVLVVVGLGRDDKGKS